MSHGHGREPEHDDHRQCAALRGPSAQAIELSRNDSGTSAVIEIEQGETKEERKPFRKRGPGATTCGRRS
jgi:hypothetical protein